MRPSASPLAARLRERSAGILALAVSLAGCSGPPAPMDLGADDLAADPAPMQGHCQNQVRDSDERDIDCGGEDCAPCADGRHCVAGVDCLSTRCDRNLCVSCLDGVQNGDEVGVDCGGRHCPGCADGHPCSGPSDCRSKVCEGGRCVSCDDGARNQDEADADCGGTICEARCCANRSCNRHSDCSSRACVDHHCLAASTCDDGILAGTESDVDCGGRDCPPCTSGKSCYSGLDCAGGLCLYGLCAACNDGILNGDETDTDCGGPDCPPCDAGKTCREAAGCQNGNCVGGRCVPPACNDGLKNGGETDIDCGGPCPGCAARQACGRDMDCASATCRAGTCVRPACINGVKDGAESDIDCGGPDCAGCPLGSACAADADCKAGICTNKKCDISCLDRRLDGDETDIDCGGSCPPCATNASCHVDADCASPNRDAIDFQVCARGVCRVKCMDGIKEPDETDVDCGGGCIQPHDWMHIEGWGCRVGQRCRSSADCIWIRPHRMCDQIPFPCVGGMCVEPCHDGRRDVYETGIDCGHNCKPMQPCVFNCDTPCEPCPSAGPCR